MLYIFTAGLLWGTIGIFVKTLAALGADSALTCCLRMAFAFLIMLTLSLIKHGRGIIIRDKKVLLFTALFGLVCHGMQNICYTTSIKLNGMAIACVLMYTAPVFTALASRLIFHEQITKQKIFALTVNIIGCILTVTGGKISGDTNFSLLGLLAGLGTGFSYGMAAVIGKAAGEKTDAILFNTYSYLFATIFLIMFMRPEINLDAKILGTGFLYGLIPTALAYIVYYNGLRKIRDSSRVPVIASIEPVTAVLIGMFVYGEELGLTNFAGVVIVLASILIEITIAHS